MSPYQELLLLHLSLGHPTFATMSCIYPSLFNACPREFLVCDACDLAKHTRVPYPSLGFRSNKPFDIIHSDVWGPCESVYLALSAEKQKDLCALIKNKFGSTIKVLRSDNGTEYVNHEFEQFLTSNGIGHQTTCVNTLEQNGVAERKK
ncbi:hypothetical protein U9M48_027557 [Paspalum notatum var. saurae]|uniref:Integrase catalytic domain-containing protein n=1 Tax=Paspalum notatum var. saurae TaxID=547442 RepID=A0AAQ3TZP1_PASNO